MGDEWTHHRQANLGHGHKAAISATPKVIFAMTGDST